MSNHSKDRKDRILVIEDEVDIATFISQELIAEGFQVDVAHDGQHGLTAARQYPHDLIILDWMLPDMEGIEICRRLRQNSDVPILMLTARTAIAERVEGLQSGANDYVLKPFSLEELMARVQVQLRSRKPAVERDVFQFADLMFDVDAHEVHRGERSVSLSPKEFELLKVFMAHPRSVLGRERLLTEVWGYDFDGADNVLEVYVRYLRQKLEAKGESRLIQTVWGVGYILKEAEAA